MPLPGAGSQRDTALPVEGTVAGWAYRTMSLRLSCRRPLAVWPPLVDGIARIGVLHVTAEQLTPALLEGATQLAAVTAVTVVSKSGFSDLSSRTCHRSPMTTAEMVWVFLPLRTARRSVSRPDHISYFIAYCPAEATLDQLIRIEGSRWAIEECFRSARGSSWAAITSPKTRRCTCCAATHRRTTSSSARLPPRLRRAHAVMSSDKRLPLDVG